MCSSSGGAAAAAPLPPASLSAECQVVVEEHVRTMAQMFILTIVFSLLVLADFLLSHRQVRPDMITALTAVCRSGGKSHIWEHSHV